MSSVLVLGGARSGKSRYAEGLARGQKLYIATAEVMDDEMRARIVQHQQQRGCGWTTVEAPLELAAVLQREDKASRFILIDCLTVWLGNLMHHGRDAMREIEALAQTVAATKGRVVLVSNEVGQGIVPENAMARQFRDLQGICNQRIAVVADEVVMVIAGIPVPVKTAQRRRGKGPAAALARRRRV